MTGIAGPGGHAPKMERDEILEAEMRDRYRDLGLDEDSIAEAMSAARDAGMFGVPGRARDTLAP